MRYSGSTKGGVIELNELKPGEAKENPQGATSAAELKQDKGKADIDEPLMKDELGSSFVNLMQFDVIDTVVTELRKTNMAGLHYYGSGSSKNRKLLEERLRSAYLVINDSPLQPCNVFAPLGHYHASGLGRIKGFDGSLD